ncbi:MAG: glycosyltransferase family 39 protein, partial [Thermoplasmata archaeon]
MKPTTESRWKRNAVRLLSTIAILGLFLLYSYKPLVSRGGFVHIDTGPTILISEEAASSGRFWLNEPLNAVFPYPLFTRQASTNLTNDPTKIVPVGPLGIHVIAATRSATNDMVPFLIISAIGVLGAVCLFYLVQNLFGRWELSLLSTALYSTFPSVAYWNNFLIPNLPALSLLLASTYFFHRGLLRRDKRYYLASSALLAAAIWLRYELAIVPIITLPVALLYFRKQWKDFALIGLIVAALLSPIAALNTEIYGDPMKMGYILKPGSTETTAFDLLRVPMHIDLQILATNLSTEVVHRSTLLFVATLPGLAIYIKRYRSKGIHSDTVLLPWTFFSLYILLRIGTASSLGGYGQTVQISSYSRYFSYLAPLLSILSAVAIFEI